MSPIPEPGRGAHQQGCHRCGRPTTRTISLEARPLRKPQKKGESPYLPGSTTRQRSFCEDCADAVWDEMFPSLDREGS